MVSAKSTGPVRRLADRFQSQTLRALRKYPNFRLYWAGALASNMGTWMQMIAQGWLVYDLTGSAIYLGLVSFATAIPNLFLPLVGGVLADRFERRRLMMVTQSASMCLAFLLAYLTLTGQVTVWHIIAIAFVNGVVFSFNTPVRQTIVSDLVSKEDLTNAIAISSVQFQISRMVGPAFAGIAIATVGPGWCFFLNAVSFLAVIGALAAMKMPPRLYEQRRASLWRNITEGISYIRGEPTILALLGLVAIPAMFAMPYSQLMPAFAKAVLGVGAEGLGLLMSAAGLGAVLGALTVASLGNDSSRGWLTVGAVAVFGLCLVGLAVSPSFGLSLLFLVGAGAAAMSYSSLTQSYLQTLAEDRMRGRVMSILTLATFGLQPLGTLGAGTVADTFGPAVAVFAGGLVAAVYAFWTMAYRPSVRRLR
ncbi:MAG: MFS transporter [Chloroflexota bacterium]